MSGEWISELKSRICELGEASSCASLSGDSVRNESCVPVSKIVSWLCNNDPFNFNKPPDKPLLPLTVKKSAKVWLSGQARSAAEQWQVQLAQILLQDVWWSSSVNLISVTLFYFWMFVSSVCTKYIHILANYRASNKWGSYRGQWAAIVHH